MSIEIKRAATEIASKVKGALAGGAVAGVTSVAGLDTLLLWLWNDFLHGFLAFLPLMTPQVAGIIIALLGALVGGWATPDKLPSGTVAQVPAIGPNPTVVTAEIKTPAAQQKDAA
jgi:hypothetical protein